MLAAGAAAGASGVLANGVATAGRAGALGPGVGPAARAGASGALTEAAAGASTLGAAGAAGAEAAAAAADFLLAGFFTPSLPSAAGPAGAATWTGNVSRILRTTGGSMVEDADLTNSPFSFRWLSNILLSTPSSFASS